jgi:hypothetical protein
MGAFQVYFECNLGVASGRVLDNRNVLVDNDFLHFQAWTRRPCIKLKGDSKAGSNEGKSI